jgi:hypothetical protein
MLSIGIIIINMTYGELTRSTEPWDWRAELERVLLNHERFNAHLCRLIEEMEDKYVKDGRGSSQTTGT